MTAWGVWDKGFRDPSCVCCTLNPWLFALMLIFLVFFFFFSGSRSLVYCDGLKGGYEVWLKMAGSGAEQKIWEASLLL